MQHMGSGFLTRIESGPLYWELGVLATGSPPCVNLFLMQCGGITLNRNLRVDSPTALLLASIRLMMSVSNFLQTWCKLNTLYCHLWL